MTMMSLLRTTINTNDSLISLDVQDAYLQVLILPSDRRFLRLIRVVLPFSISTARDYLHESSRQIPPCYK